VIVTRSVTGQDGDGNDVYGTVEVSTSGAFAPEGSIELVQGQATVISRPTVYLSLGAPTPTAATACGSAASCTRSTASRWSSSTPSRATSPAPSSASSG
jgi:hypothetical protein